MMRPTRSLLAQVFVVLAIAALASIALAPRGMLRAAVADDLAAPADTSTALDAPAQVVELPGVRAVVSREEQDPGEALREALTTVVLPGPALRTAVAPSWPVDAPLPPTPAGAPPSANGDRAPPSSI